MIVRNEERFIERALACARPLCDEMIVVDTGSKDRTVELALGMGAKVSHFEWIDDFSAARNAAIEQCTGDWIMILDADDVIPPESQQKILELKDSILSDSLDVVDVTYNYLYDESGRCTMSFLRERLIRRSSGLRFSDAVHERILYDPIRALCRPDITIQHRADETLRPMKLVQYRRILQTMIADGDESAKTMKDYAFDLILQQRWAEAKTYLLKLLAAAPNPDYAYNTLNHLSLCADSLGDHEEAVVWARRAVAIDRGRAEAYIRIALYHKRRREWEMAIPYLRAVLSLDNPHHPSTEAQYTTTPWELLSFCYEGAGNIQAAVECTLRALSFKRDTDRIRRNLHILIDKL